MSRKSIQASYPAVKVGLFVPPTAACGSCCPAFQTPRIMVRCTACARCVSITACSARAITLRRAGRLNERASCFRAQCRAGLRAARVGHPAYPPPNPTHPTESHSSHRIPLIPPNPTHPTESHSSHRIPLIPPNPTCPTESHSSHRIPLIPPNPACPGRVPRLGVGVLAPAGSCG